MGSAKNVLNFYGAVIQLLRDCTNSRADVYFEIKTAALIFSRIFFVVFEAFSSPMFKIIITNGGRKIAFKLITSFVQFIQLI